MSELIKRQITVDEHLWLKLQKQAVKYNTTPSLVLDYILRGYYQLERKTNQQ